MCSLQRWFNLQLGERFIHRLLLLLFLSIHTKTDRGKSLLLSLDFSVLSVKTQGQLFYIFTSTSSVSISHPEITGLKIAQMYLYGLRSTLIFISYEAITAPFLAVSYIVCLYVIPIFSYISLQAHMTENSFPPTSHLDQITLGSPKLIFFCAAKAILDHNCVTVLLK